MDEGKWSSNQKWEKNKASFMISYVIRDFWENAAL